MHISDNCHPHHIFKKMYHMEKRDISNRIEYVVACVGAFAQRYMLSNQQAYAYLRRFSGIDFLIKHYGVIHTLSIEDAVDDLQQFCFNQGGKIS